MGGGGGGPLLTGTIDVSKAINCHSELVSESVPRYEQVFNIDQTLKRVQGDNISSLRADECRRGNPVKNTASPYFHSELRERAEAQSENHAFRGAVLRESSKTVPASIQRCVLPVSLDRSRNKFGMTLAEPVLQLALSACTTRKVGATDVTQSSSRGANEVSDLVIQATKWHPRLVGHDFLTPVQLGSRLDRRWIATRSATARNDRGWLVHAAFTMTARLRRSTESRAIKGLRAHGRRIAFTMAEILLSLTIIGVVAAITLPSLTGNINERTWNTQRKALYARFSQAIALMPALNGYGTLTEDSSSGASDAVDTAAETFITAGLSKVMKINNICDNEHLPDCGIASKITTLDASTMSFPTTMEALNSNMVGSYSTAVDNASLLNTKAAAFETQNGESIAVYYNPRCIGDLNNSGWGSGGVYIAPKVCANFIFDLNGNKGPNTVGKDIGFLTVMYPSDPKVVMPYPANNMLGSKYTHTAAVKACTTYDPEYRLPNVEEANSILVNKNLVSSTLDGLTFGNGIWTSSPVAQLSRGNYWLVYDLQADDWPKDNSLNVWCVKR